MYLDAVRFSVIGDRARAAKYFHFARKLLYDLVRLGADSGVTIARRQVPLPDGTVITVSIAGLEANAEIDVTKLPPDESNTRAYIAQNATTPPQINVVDVEREKSLKTITGLGQIVALHCSLDGQYLYAFNTIHQLIKLDIAKMSAIALDLSSNPFIYDFILSADGTKLHLRFNESGLGFDLYYGGVWTYDAKTLTYLGASPTKLQGSSFVYGMASHPKAQRLYLNVFGDGDGDPTTNPFADPSGYYQDAIESYDWNAPALVAGMVQSPPYLPSSTRWAELAIDAAGKRLYTVSTAAQRFIGDPLVNTDVPTFRAFDVTDGGLTLLQSLLPGIKLTGNLAVSRDGAFVYATARSNLVYVIRTSDFAITTFPFRPNENVASEGSSYSGVRIGPKNTEPKPDNRIFFLSQVERTLWAFKPGATKPAKKITLTDAVSTFALGKAPPRKGLPQGDKA